MTALFVTKSGQKTRGGVALYNLQAHYAPVLTNLWKFENKMLILWKWWIGSWT